MAGGPRIRIDRANQRDHEPEKLSGSERVRARAIYASAGELSEESVLDRGVVMRVSRGVPNGTRAASSVCASPALIINRATHRHPPKWRLSDDDAGLFHCRRPTPVPPSTELGTAGLCPPLPDSIGCRSRSRMASPGTCKEGQ